MLEDISHRSSHIFDIASSFPTTHFVFPALSSPQSVRVRVSFLELRCIVFFFLPSSLVMFILERESRWGYIV